MTKAPREGARPAGAAIEQDEAEVRALERMQPSPSLTLHDLLPDEAAPRAPEPPVAAGMRTGRVTAVAGHRATLVLRGRSAPVEAVIAPEVDPAVIEDARASGDAVLVEIAPEEAPVVVGVLQTQRPRALHLKAATVHIEGEEEVLLRSGRGAVRIRSDGEVEVVGSRISATSRGLFRIVGRILRLN